ncbi:MULTISPECIES: glucose-6-phosphate dehydrogenase [unclassified Cupriavidus]|uniref:glucose-6-phosphate dehydrogenase n=1 Tax=unclassified Cupriavidus TaxID=2640874 RepID=UPI003F9122B9
MQKVPKPPPATLFLFGARGDLVQRLLVPALYNLRRDGLLCDGLDLVGVDHNPMTDAAFRARLAQGIRARARPGGEGGPQDKDKGGAAAKVFDAGMWNPQARRISYLQGDFLDDRTYAAIAARIKAAATGNAVFYLATSPRFFGEVVDRLAAAGLLKESASAFRRVVIEKPFGTDLRSAQALNARVLRAMREEQVYRIDHFLGKETVQNILVSRFANGLFEAFWNNHYVDHVQITAAETVGVEQRGNFYEHTGALRDMVPNHLFQLMGLVAMEPPAAFGADAVRAEKAKLIGAIRPQTRQEALASSVRGQYRGGTVAGHKVPAYRSEPDVSRDSRTETYVALKLMVDNWRWDGVPFYLRTGKRMAVRDTEIAICFKQAPSSLFRDTRVDRLKPNFLTIQIQPDEGMWFDFQAKRPGPAVEIDNVQMGFAYSTFFNMRPSTGYETLIYDCLIGDQTLFQRADNIENGWRAVQPFLDAWQDAGKGATEVQGYRAGSDGPRCADALLARDGRSWHRAGPMAAPA